MHIHVLLFPKHIVFHSLMVCFLLANNADPDEIPRYAALERGISSGSSLFANNT